MLFISLLVSCQAILGAVVVGWCPMFLVIVVRWSVWWAVCCVVVCRLVQVIAFVVVRCWYWSVSGFWPLFRLPSFLHPLWLGVYRRWSGYSSGCDSSGVWFFYVVVWECGRFMSVEDYPVCGCLFECVFFWVAQFNGGYVCH